MADNMMVLEHEVGDLTKKVADKSGRNAQLQKNLKGQASRLITNGLQRAYGGSTARSFQKWKETIRCDKHKENVMRKTIHHM